MNKRKMSLSKTIFHESLIVDYVAGHLTQAQKRNFENELAGNTELQNAVNIEKRLRAVLNDLDASETLIANVRGEGLNRVLSMIDTGEDEENFKHHATPPINAGLLPSWFAYAGIAASLAFAILFLYLPHNDGAQDYTLLSDQFNSKQIDFGGLVEKNRVAQVWPTAGVTNKRLNMLFLHHQLTVISRSAHAWIVTSDEAFTPELLSKLESTEDFARIRLVSFDGNSTYPDK